MRRFGAGILLSTPGVVIASSTNTIAMKKLEAKKSLPSSKVPACRLWFFRLKKINGKSVLSRGKLLVYQPYSVENDDLNDEFRCQGRREQPFRSDSKVVCQVQNRCTRKLKIYGRSRSKSFSCVSHTYEVLALPISFVCSLSSLPTYFCGIPVISTFNCCLARHQTSTLLMEATSRSVSTMDMQGVR